MLNTTKECIMFRSILNSICAAQQASAATKVLAYMTDAQLANLGHTRATFVENVKNNFIASLEVKPTTKQNHAPVNANLAGAF
jgi:nucleoside diphosphate kinase